MARKPVFVVLFALALLLATGLSGVHAVATATAPGDRPLWHGVAPLVPRPASPPSRPPATGLLSIGAAGDLTAGTGLSTPARALLRADLTTANATGRLTAAGAAEFRRAGLTTINGYGSTVSGVTTVEVRGIRVAIVGLPAGRDTDPTAARRAVTAAARSADLVVVHARLGAPGRYRVAGGTERHRGEDHGDPVRFAHGLVDAGADLVLGHGPGVLRGLEFHRGRLIAYSLGTFAGTGTRTGRYAAAGVLRVTLRADGRWAGGTFTATRPDRTGRPVPDRAGTGLRYVRDLSAADFPGTGPVIGATGALSAG